MRDVRVDGHLGIALRAALWVGLAYFLMGSFWILFSDMQVVTASPSAEWLVTAQRFKGLGYVAVTTAALVFLVYRWHRRVLGLEDRAQRSDLRVQDLFEHHPQPMWVYELQTYRFLRVNHAAVVAYGYSEAEFLAMSALDIRPREDVASFRAAAQGHLIGPGSPGVFRQRRKDGSTMLARISEHVVELEGVQAMLAMAEDVTEAVGLQDAVSRQQRQFEQLHRSLAEVLWIAPPDLRSVSYVSPAFEQVYGRRPAELLANPDLWRQAVHPEDVDQVANVLALPPGQDSVQCEYRIVRPDGSVRWIEDRKQLIRDTTGAVVLIGGIAEDITTRMERNEARDALNQRLATLVAERTAELQQANIELEAFSGTAAHDLKSPLNGIVGMSGLLRLRAANKLDETETRYLDVIERSSRNMATLIDDLLQLSRAGSVELQRQLVDLAPAVRAQFFQLKALEPLRRAEVVVPDRLALYCDEGLMYSVLQNFIGNAWKFTGEKAVAHIELSLEHEADRSVLTVSDNGAGFDASGMGELLRPFQRFHAPSRFQGTGLGLVTCQRIAHRHGGRLMVESTPGVGTRVSIALPRSSAA